MRKLAFFLLILFLGMGWFFYNQSKPLFPQKEQGEERIALPGEEDDREPIVQLPRDLTGGSSFAYNGLTNIQKTVYNEILKGIEEMETSFPVSSMDQEEISIAFHAVLIDHPELFYLEPGCDLYTEKLGDKILKVEFRPRYTMDKKKREETQEKIDEYAAKCFASIPQGASDYEKVKGVYEYLILHTDYELNAPDNQNICSIFLNGKTVCQGYAKGTQYLLNRLGVFCTLVDGYGKNNERHAWNLVEVDGEYYYVDTTWGDASYTIGEGDAGLADRMPEISYDYLCMNDEQLFKTHVIDSMLEIPPCNSLSANYYVREGLYFTQVDEIQLKQCFEKAYEEEKESITLKCADREVYEKMQSFLVEENRIFVFMPSSQGVEFLRTDETCILIFYLV